MFNITRMRWQNFRREPDGRPIFKLAFWAIVPSLAFSGAGAHAADYTFDDIEVTAHGVVSAGNLTRTEGQNPILSQTSKGTFPGGQNGDTNFQPGESVSTAFKGIGALDIHKGAFGVYLVGKAWADPTLTYGTAPIGNYPNNYVPNTPLSDKGFNNLSKFNGLSLQNAYAYGTLAVADMPLVIRAGEQTIPWGARGLIPGGLSASVVSFDSAEFHRPGLLLESSERPASTAFRPDFLPNETSIPQPALFTSLQVTPSFKLEAFWQVVFTPNNIDACGTFYSVSNFLAQGCNIATLTPALSSQAAIANGIYYNRANVPILHDMGEFGVGGAYKIEPLRTEVGLYFTQTDWRSPLVDIITGASAKHPFVPFDDAINPQYYTKYAPQIGTIAANFKTNLASKTTIIGESTYRANQPVSINLADMGVSTTNPVAAVPSELRTLTQAAGQRGILPAYEEFKTFQQDLLVAQNLGSVLGSSDTTVAAQGTYKHVFDLPSLSFLRFGRADLYGQAALPGSTCTGGAVTCNNSGFVTSNAFGVGARLTMHYSNVWGSGWSAEPILVYRYDVSGYSYDNVLNQGRQNLVVSTRFDFKNTYYLLASYNPTWGGTYNNLVDRGSFLIAAGFVF